MHIEKESVQELTTGHQAVGTTRVKLAEQGFTAYKGVLMRCPGTSDPVSNTAPVWIGGKNVAANSGASGGIPLLPGDALFVPIDKLDSIWCISSADGQDIAWMGI